MIKIVYFLLAAYISSEKIQLIINFLILVSQMGLLKDLGALLSFDESQQMQEALKKIGIRQFLLILKKFKKWNKETSSQHIKWGQQIEGFFLHQKESGDLQLCKCPLGQQYQNLKFPLFFEYGSFMFQMTPSQPYNTGCNWNQIIDSIRNKYEVLQKKSRIAMTIPCVPMLGVRQKEKQNSFVNDVTQSLFIDDNHISRHIRFPTLTRNIRTRRGRTVQIKVPILPDENTNLKMSSQQEPYPGFIYMDAMAFGMGLSCLQCTFSTKNLDHARYLYDQLHIISPLFLALTAGTPFHKGKIADWDARWKIIEGSVDDRKPNQRNPDHEDYLPTSRYSPAQLYIWEGQFNRKHFNDYPLNIKPALIQEVKNASKQLGIEVDDLLALHLANIFKRDVLIVHENFKNMGIEDNTIFQMLNGTNWNSVRLKIPTDQNIGWRVQFRTMEVMLTADENSAFSLIIHLITRALHISTDLNFYVPISVVMQNFDRAHKKDAVRKQKFLFRTNIEDNQEPKIEELTLHQILFGKDDYPGFYNLIQKRIYPNIQICQKMQSLLKSIKQLLINITTGKRLTLAQYMRKFVYQHPLYMKDSILPKKVYNQLMRKLNDISSGQVKDENFPPIFEF